MNGDERLKRIKSRFLDCDEEDTDWQYQALAETIAIAEHYQARIREVEAELDTLLRLEALHRRVEERRAALDATVVEAAIALLDGITFPVKHLDVPRKVVYVRVEDVRELNAALAAREKGEE